MQRHIRGLKNKFYVKELASFENVNSNHLTVDNVPVTQEVAALANALRSKMPWIKFGVAIHDKDRNEQINKAHEPFTYLYVYRENDLLAMGAIGHDRMRDSNDDLLYFVFAPKIHNNVRMYGTRRHMRMSKKMDVVVKHALGNLVILGVEDAINKSLSEFILGYLQKRDENIAGLAKELSRFSEMFSVYSHRGIDKSKLLNVESLRRAAETDFWQGDLKDTIIKASDAAKTVVRLQAARVNVYCVMVTKDPIQGVICTVKPVYLDKEISHYLYLSNEEAKVYQENQLPENLMQALGVLNIAEECQLIEGTGMKINPQLFYVVEEVDQ